MRLAFNEKFLVSVECYYSEVVEDWDQLFLEKVFKKKQKLQLERENVVSKGSEVIEQWMMPYRSIRELLINFTN